MISAYKWVSLQAERKAARLPSEWDQRFWIREESCGTVACVAGHIALNNGGKPFTDDSWGAFVRLNGVERRVSEVAAETLGITPDQAEVLFYYRNSIHDLRHMMSTLVGENIARLV
jgi:hypothetical protein